MMKKEISKVHIPQVGEEKRILEKQWIWETEKERDTGSQN